MLVVGGQSLCLLLTLLAVPVFYSLFEDLGDSFVTGRVARVFGWLRRRVHRRPRRSPPPWSAVALRTDAPVASCSPLKRSARLKPRVGILGQTTLRLPEVIERVLANDPDLRDLAHPTARRPAIAIRGAQGDYDPRRRAARLSHARRHARGLHPRRHGQTAS